MKKIKCVLIPKALLKKMEKEHQEEIIRCKLEAYSECQDLLDKEMSTVENLIKIIPLQRVWSEIVDLKYKLLQEKEDENN